MNIYELTNKSYNTLFVLVFVAIASVFNSAMDQIKFHPDTSIFANIENEVVRTWVLENGVYEEQLTGWAGPFQPALSFMYDGWHFAKQMMVLCFLLATSVLIYNRWSWRILHILLCGLVWMFVHVAFYNNLLRFDLWTQ